MTIQEALEKAKKGSTISSKSANMYLQKKKDLVYWLIQDPRSTKEEKVKELLTILEATDWEIDEKPMY